MFSRFNLTIDNRGRLTKIVCPVMYDVRHLVGLETLSIEESKGGSTSKEAKEAKEAAEAIASSGSNAKTCKDEESSKNGAEVFENTRRTVKAR